MILTAIGGIELLFVKYLDRSRGKTVEDDNDYYTSIKCIRCNLKAKKFCKTSLLDTHGSSDTYRNTPSCLFFDEIDDSYFA